MSAENGLNGTMPAVVKPKELKRLTYTHEAMVDLIIAEPTVKPGELAELFGYTPGWISRILVSDSFQSRLAERKSALTDPLIAQSLNERLRGVTMQAVEIVSEKLNSADASASYALDALGLAVGGMRKGTR